MTRNFLLLCLAFIFAAQHASAQNEANVWHFGLNAGIDFNSGTAVAVRGSGMRAAEGSSCISDPVTGQLLFYTQGELVYNRNHALMDEGQGLLDWNCWGSAMQGSMVTPWPGHPDNYLIFSVDCNEANGGSRTGNSARYAVVDMTANGGLGKVVEKKNRLVRLATEKITGTIHCNGRDYWVIIQEAETSRFYAYLVSPKGVAEPVVSEPIQARGGLTGVIKTSPDGTKLAVTYQFARASELYDFDPQTGMVSNGFVLVNGRESWGASFSPDNSKLYVTTRFTTMKIAQYDLQAGSNDQIRLSEVQLNTGNESASVMQQAPDGKIYVASEIRLGALGVINEPNRPGTACDWNPATSPGGFDLGGDSVIIGLPVFIESFFSDSQPDPSLCPLPTAGFNLAETEICPGGCLSINNTSTDGSSYLWTFEGADTESSTEFEPQNICYSTPGTYSIRQCVINENGWNFIDLSVTVKDDCLEPIPNFSLSETEICPGDCIDIIDNSQNADSYEWDFSGASNTTSSTDTEPTNICYNTPGSYTITLKLTNANGEASTTRELVVVNSCPTPTVDFSLSAETICAGECIDISNATTDADSYDWDFSGASNITNSSDENPPSICYDSPGTYTIRLDAANANGSSSEQVSLTVLENFRIQLTLADVQAEAGFTGLRIPLSISLPDLAGSFNLPELQLSVRGHSALLDFIDATDATNVNPDVNGAEASISFTIGSAIVNSSDFVLTEIIVNTVHGFPLELTDLTLEAMPLVSDCVSLELTGGSYEQLHTCPAGHLSLGTTLQTVVSVQPNPAVDVLTVDVSTNVAGDQELALFNSWGERKSRFHWQHSDTDDEARSYRFTIPTNELASGAYQLVLRNGSRVESRSVLIVK